MCTAISLRTPSHYFGRTLDLDRSYGEEVCVVPRFYPLTFCHMGRLDRHYAMVGMATVVRGTPLYYDAVNEHGLAIAGLNFPGNAHYAPLCETGENIASFELIPWILAQCVSVDEAEVLLCRMNLCDTAFLPSLPPSPLHWMISDSRRDIVVEFMRDGVHIYENKVGVLTNNPPFDIHLANLERYSRLRNDNKNVTRDDSLGYVSYCQGLGAVGLPGDVSSMSRFVRAAFGVEHSLCEKGDIAEVSQFFHILGSVEMIRGLCMTDEGTWDITGYTCSMDTSLGLYYYTAYSRRCITCVNMHLTDLDGTAISRYPLLRDESIFYQNKE